MYYLFSKCKIVQLGDVKMHVSSVALFLSFCICIIGVIRTAERYLLLERGKETARRMLKERVLKQMYLLKEIKEWHNTVLGSIHIRGGRKNER